MNQLVPNAAHAFAREALSQGRNEGPRLLAEWWVDGRLSRAELRAVIGEVWMLAEWPAPVLGQKLWVELFRHVGFVSDDPEHRPQPTEPLEVYRGTTWGRRRGMSWTERSDRAEWFAARWDRSRPGTGLVIVASVPPAAVLARLGDPDGRDEAEVVVDPSMLPPIGRPRS